MGGWVPYDRFRHRNGLEWWPADPHWPYPPPAVVNERERPPGWYGLVGDLNRMETDYLAPVYPQDVSHHVASRLRGSSPAEVCAREVGVDVETVRAVLAHVFHRGLRL